MLTTLLSTMCGNHAGRLALSVVLLTAIVPWCGAAQEISAQEISGSSEVSPRSPSSDHYDRIGIREGNLKPDLFASQRDADVLALDLSDPLTDATTEARPAASQKANGLDLVGTVGYTISPANGTVNMRVEEVRNSRSGGLSGTLRLELWATTNRPVFGETINGFRLGRYQFSQQLPGGFSFIDVNRTVAYTPPPAGCYYINLLLLEFISSSEGYIYQDFFTFDDRVGLNGGSCGPTFTCVQNSTTLCLNNNRFKVQVFWRDFFGNVGAGQRAVAGTDDSGIMWFFDADNWEMLLKVLNGCAINNRYWVFFAATTNVEFSVEVTDTRTGLVMTYFNPLGRSADAVTDTSAFATCP